MKKNMLIVLISISLLIIAGCKVSETGEAIKKPVAPATSSGTGMFLVPLYALYSTAFVDYAYTINETERKAALTRGYQDKGIAAYVYPESYRTIGAVPFYKLWSQKWLDFAYTVNETERSLIKAKFNYTDKGIAAYIYTQNNNAATLPLFRLYKPFTDYAYTTSESQKQAAIRNLGYQDKGIAGYVFTPNLTFYCKDEDGSQSLLNSYYNSTSTTYLLILPPGGSFPFISLVPITRPDTCNSDGYTLTEQYCDTRNKNIEFGIPAFFNVSDYTCPNGCRDGACIR